MPELLPVEPGTAGWLAYRMTGVTATDIVTILGLSHWNSVYSLFWRKMGEVLDEPDRDRFALGRHMEPYVVEKWLDAHEPYMDACVGGLWRNDARPWQLATPDQLVDHSPLECKSWADADKRSWEAGPPPAVRAQLLWQMDTLDVARGYWGVVFLPSGRFAHGVIEHDEGCFRNAGFTASDRRCSVCLDVRLMRSAGYTFYRRMLHELPSPDPDESAATMAALKARFGPLPEQAEVGLGSWNAWYGAKIEEDRWHGLRLKYEQELRLQAGHATELTVNGEVVIKRIVSDAKVKAHVRHMDYYRNVTRKEDDNASD